MFLVKLLPKVELKFKAHGQSYLPGESPSNEAFWQEQETTLHKLFNAFEFAQ